MRFVDQPQIIYHRARVRADRVRTLHLQAYDYVDLWVQVTELGGAPASATMNVKFQYRAPRIPPDASDTWLDVPGKAMARITEATPLPAQQVVTLTPEDLKTEAFRLVVDVSFIGGADPFWGTFLSLTGRSGRGMEDAVAGATPNSRP